MPPDLEDRSVTKEITLMDSETLKVKLERHLRWRRGEPDGERANLSTANLSTANPMPQAEPSAPEVP
jgi:hypothetical protein